MATASLLSGCGQEAPQGQVLAIVGKDAITRRDLEAERAAAAQSGIADLSGPEGVERLVSRELLVQAAEARDLALTPEYLAAVRRSRDDILIAMVRDQVAAGLRPPSAAELTAFIAARPWMFQQRALLSLEGISTDRAAGDETRFTGMTSLDEAARQLAVDKRPANRWHRRVDTAQLPSDDAMALLGAGGSMVTLLGDRRTRFIVVAGREAAPILGQEAIATADSVVRRTKLERALEAVVERERKRSSVRYQEGFGPAAR